MSFSVVVSMRDSGRYVFDSFARRQAGKGDSTGRLSCFAHGVVGVKERLPIWTGTENGEVEYDEVDWIRGSFDVLSDKVAILQLATK